MLKYYALPVGARQAYDNDDLTLQETCVTCTEPDDVPPEDTEMLEGWQSGDRFQPETLLGHVIFNDALPREYPLVSYVVAKKELGKVANGLAELCTKAEIEVFLDALKSFGFHRSMWSGITISFTGIVPPSVKPEILEKHEDMAADIQSDYDPGAITEEDRHSGLIKLWEVVTNEVAQAMGESFSERNAIYRMVRFGMCGNWFQIRQITDMRGPMSNPKQRPIERLIKSNYHEGLSVSEYFITAHGVCKGPAGMALRTAESGYSTWCLADVSQDVTICGANCGTRKGLEIVTGHRNDDGVVKPDKLVETTTFACALMCDTVNENDGIVPTAGEDVGDVAIYKLLYTSITETIVHSVLTCGAPVGTCAACYGRPPVTGKRVNVGEAVGIIAAQSTGGPGTQLTMCIFRTGDAQSGSGITQGLPYVQELFEARTPKGETAITEAAGCVKINDDPMGTRGIIIVRDNGKDDLVIGVSRCQKLPVAEGDQVEADQKLTEGLVNLKKLLRVKGQQTTQKALVSEVQQVYHSQGADIHAKHTEVIARQMLRRMTVLEEVGDTDFLSGELADQVRFLSENHRMVEQNKQPVSARPELMGTTEASLATDSWLSAALFQETTHVLTEAAINSTDDPLSGLKESVILGRLIPVGIGLVCYRNVGINPSEKGREALMARLPYSDTIGFRDFTDFSDMSVNSLFGVQFR